MSSTTEPGLVPPHGELRVVDDVPRAFTELVEEVALRATKQGPSRVGIALSGGATARACYEQLAKSTRVPWPQIECYLGDERCVPPDDPDANQRMIREALGERLAAGSFHPMVCNQAAEYGLLIERAEPLDLIHLGLGPDGHTASLFPSSAALDAPAGTFVAHNADPTGSNPHERLTLTFDAINRTRLAVFTVSGAAKHQALHRVLAGDDLPASHVRAERVVWLCDSDALGEDLDRVR
ncbi:MAG: 6-phosphogluconolactonase [Acidimicrobiales bacterium]